MQNLAIVQIVLWLMAGGMDTESLEEIVSTLCGGDLRSDLEPHKVFLQASLL